jgi:hypothetical protein
MADTTQKSGLDLNAIAQILATLLPVLMQFGLPLVEKAISAIKQDPTLPTDVLKDTILKRLSDASAINNQILNEN